MKWGKVKKMHKQCFLQMKPAPLECRAQAGWIVLRSMTSSQGKMQAFCVKGSDYRGCCIFLLMRGSYHSRASFNNLTELESSML